MTLFSASSRPVNPKGDFDEVRYLGNGAVQYLRDGRFHRVNGPAVILRDGTTEFWVRGKPSTAAPTVPDNRRIFAQ